MDGIEIHLILNILNLEFLYNFQEELSTVH